MSGKPKFPALEFNLALLKEARLYSPDHDGFVYLRCDEMQCDMAALARLFAQAPRLLFCAEQSVELFKALEPIFAMMGTEQANQISTIIEVITEVRFKALGGEHAG